MSFQTLRRQGVVAALDGIQALGSFARRHGDEGWYKSSPPERLLCLASVTWRDIGIGNDCAAGAQFEAGALAAQVNQKTWTNLDVVTARPKPHFDDAHRLRMNGWPGSVKKAFQKGARTPPPASA